MADKILNTRIQLKYDTLTNWQSGPFNGTDNTKWLKAGELAIVTLAPNKETAPTSKADQHPLLFKVGTGSHKFDDLPWASALAADVYDWAKKPEAEFIEWVNSIVTHPTIPDGFNIAVGSTDDNVVDVNLQGGKNSISGTIEHAKKGPTNGYNGGQTAATADAFGESVTIKVTKLTVDDYGHVNSASDVEYKVSIPAAPTIPNIKITDDTDVEKPTTATVNVYKNLTANGHTLTEELVEVATAKGVADALDAAKKYADANDANTAHTHVAGSGIKVNGTENGGIDGAVKLDLNIAFELSNRTIKLYDKDDAKKTAIATLDASEFIKDGMIKSVELVDADGEGNSGKFLKITWNTPALDDDDTITYVDLTTLIDVYTAGTGINVNGKVISHADTSSVTNVTKTARTYVAGITFDTFGHVTGLETASETDQDLSGKKDIQSPYSASGDTTKTITNVSQNANGEITVTYSNIAFPAAPVVNNGKFTVSGTGYLTGSGSMTANQATNTTANLDLTTTVKEKIDKAVQTVTAGVGIKATKTGTTVNLEVVGKGEKDDDGSEVVWVLDCGGAQ